MMLVILRIMMNLNFAFAPQASHASESSGAKWGGVQAWMRENEVVIECDDDDDGDDDHERYRTKKAAKKKLKRVRD